MPIPVQNDSILVVVWDGKPDLPLNRWLVSDWRLEQRSQFVDFIDAP
ncbi:hypothetical protein HB777_11760 [Mesorhizobium loti]|nr:hypothetical protein HB777_11760 [Mesorhizobium loti]